jgi:hypothetical protein
MRHVLLVALLLVSALSPAAWAQDGVTYGGGDGASKETAVVVTAANEETGVAAEYAWLKEHLPGAEVESTSLAGGDKAYDIMEVTLPSGEKRTIYFDISSFFGKL